VRVLLLSTYELGNQPLGLAVPAARLRRAGHEVRACDLSVEAWPEDALAWAEALACSVPMHTALRLALEAVAAAREARPDLPVALYGLYARAAADAAARMLRPGDLLAAGDASAPLLGWLEALSRGSRPPVRLAVALGSPRPAPEPPPARDLLPPLARYAAAVLDGVTVPAVAVEASRGCSHRCRHCPVPTVYEGRSRPVPVESVLADVDQAVAAGARHVSFADPDFLNRPRHALAVARALHAHFPRVTFDATVKVSHVLDHAPLWRELADAGCRFVVSAFESVDDEVLARLDKGHTVADARRAVAVLRAVDIEPRPSFLPFTPWTRLGDLAELLRFVGEEDLVPNVDPVQYGIRLLLPPGSLLLDRPDPVLARSLEGFDPLSCSYRWHAADPAVDELQAEVARRTEDAAVRGDPVERTYADLRELAFAAAGRPDPGDRPPRAPSPLPGPLRPRRTEAWFCCAEPTHEQFAVLPVRGGSGPRCAP
jgi:radical SAM superfamily enzyme YgiQ (UPF0313 family)